VTDEQEKLIRRLASGESYHDRETRRAQLPEFQALAQVVLELAPRERSAIPLRRSRTPLRDQMKAVLVQEDLTPSTAERMIDELFDILEQDPGHNATSDVVPVTCDRASTLDEFHKIIRALRRGE
jgi:hypothetical protein